MIQVSVKKSSVGRTTCAHRCKLANAAKQWSVAINRVGAKSGVSTDGGNKLRTFARFKQVLMFEPYLTHVDNRAKCRLLTRLRLGIAPLRIETGRYEARGGSKRRIEVHERVCLCCGTDAVKDECHFVVVCSAFSKLRKHLFQVVESKCDGN